MSSKRTDFGTGYGAALTDVWGKIVETVNTGGDDAAVLDAVLEYVGENAADNDTRQALSLLTTRRVDRVTAK